MNKLYELLYKLPNYISIPIVFIFCLVAWSGVICFIKKLF